jgi:putative NADPH-quinone reductase
MDVSLILAHPNPGSFNHALAEACRDTLTGLRHAVRFHDLYAERFDPVLPAAELARDAALPPGIARHVEEIGTAEGIVIIHPNWWSQPPAILRGWTDRVLRPGRAYTFVPDGRGGAKPVGLLAARAALVINTANTPQAKEVELFGDPLDLTWRRVVFGLCGVTRVQRVTFSPVIASTPEQRQAWLAEARGAAAELFPG